MSAFVCKNPAKGSKNWFCDVNRETCENCQWFRCQHKNTMQYTARKLVCKDCNKLL